MIDISPMAAGHTSSRRRSLTLCRGLKGLPSTVPTCRRTTLSSHSRKWNWNLSSHLSPLELCLHSGLFKRGDAGSDRKWKPTRSEMDVTDDGLLAAKKINQHLSICVFFFLPINLYFFFFFFYRLLPFRDRLASSLFVQFAVSLATTPVPGASDTVNAPKWNPLPLPSFSDGQCGHCRC